MREAQAGREVIVAAGAIGSPQILELSGIGQGARLQQLGVPVVHDLAGVGENLQDHYIIRMQWRATQPVTFNELSRGLPLVREAIRYALFRKGLLTLPAADRKSVVSGKSVSARVDLGGRRIIKKKKQTII